MQESPILAFIKIVLGTILALLLFLFFLQRDDEQEKMVKISDRLEALNTSVGDLSRKVSAAEIQARAAYERTDTLVEIISKGGLVVTGSAGTGKGGGGKTPPPADADLGKPTIIAGKKIYPRNKGWTVICDSTANDDPARDIPADKIDWDAVLMDYIAGEPASLNFLGPDRTQTNAMLSDYAFDRLARPKTSNLEEYNALLAERVEMSPDRRVYKIYLRKGVRWHEPEPAMLKKHPWLKGDHYVTAEDVKFTWDIIRDPAANSPLAYMLDPLEKIEIVDELTLLVTWKEANYYAKGTTLFNIKPYPAHIWAYDPDGKKYSPDDVGAAFANHWFAKSFCGNGPYRFVEYKLGQHLRFVRNEKYWGPRATCKEWLVQNLDDNEMRLNKLLNNELVSMVFVPDADERCIKEGIPEKPFHEHLDFDAPAKGIKRDHWLYFIYDRPLFGCFGWNMRKPKFADKRVRQALTLALNRYGIVEHIQKGRGKVIPVAQAETDPNYPEGFEPLPFDLERAAKLFEEAGWTDTDGDGIRDKMIAGVKTPYEFGLIISASSPNQAQIVQLYKEDLLKIGVKLVPEPIDGALWGKRTTNREFDGFIIFWYAGYDGDPSQLWHSKGAERAGSNNYVGFQNKEADGIFDKLVTTFDKAERKKLFQRWFEIQADEQAYTVIWSVSMPFAYMGSWRIPPPSLINPKNDRRLFWKWKE